MCNVCINPYKSFRRNFNLRMQALVFAMPPDINTLFCSTVIFKTLSAETNGGKLVYGLVVDKKLPCEDGKRFARFFGFGCSQVGKAIVG